MRLALHQPLAIPTTFFCDRSKTREWFIPFPEHFVINLIIWDIFEWEHIVRRRIVLFAMILGTGKTEEISTIVRKHTSLTLGICVRYHNIYVNILCS